MSKTHIACAELTREQQFHLTKINEAMLDLSDYAKIITEDWVNISNAARPYVQAMSTGYDIDNPDSLNEWSYHFDTGREIVLRFLANAASWRGEVAREVKHQLKLMLEIK